MSDLIEVHDTEEWLTDSAEAEHEGHADREHEGQADREHEGQADREREGQADREQGRHRKRVLYATQRTGACSIPAKCTVVQPEG